MSDVVEDYELLYRCVFNELDKYYRIRESGLELSSQVFADRNNAPSVDRAKLCHSPKYTQKNPDDGVVSLIAGEVRAIEDIAQKDNKGNQLFIYKIDVHPRPTNDNPAHAQIEPSPQYQSTATFRKVTERLARLATERIKKQGWEIEPHGLLPKT